jgi:antitoxin MazE
MVTKVQKWGNSRGVRLARQILEDAGMKVGDEVEISVQKGVIILKPRSQVRGRYDLRKLLARMPKDYRPDEFDWGKPMGREIW